MKRNRIVAILLCALCLFLTGCTADLEEVSDEILSRLDEEESLTGEAEWIEAPFSRMALVTSDASVRALPLPVGEVVKGAQVGEVLSLVSAAQSDDGGLWYSLEAGGARCYIEASSVRLLTDEEAQALLEEMEEADPEEETIDEEHTPSEGTPMAEGEGV